MCPMAEEALGVGSYQHKFLGISWNWTSQRKWKKMVVNSPRAINSSGAFFSPKNFPSTSWFLTPVKKNGHQKNAKDVLVNVKASSKQAFLEKWRTHSPPVKPPSFPAWTWKVHHLPISDWISCCNLKEPSSSTCPIPSILLMVEIPRPTTWDVVKTLQIMGFQLPTSLNWFLFTGFLVAINSREWKSIKGKDSLAILSRWPLTLPLHPHFHFPLSNERRALMHTVHPVECHGKPVDKKKQNGDGMVPRLGISLYFILTYPLNLENVESFIGILFKRPWKSLIFHEMYHRCCPFSTQLCYAVHFLSLPHLSVSSRPFKIFSPQNKAESILRISLRVFLYEKKNFKYKLYIYISTPCEVF